MKSANVKYKGTIIYPYNKIKSDDFEFVLDSVCGTITLVNKKEDCKKISVTIDGAALDIFSMKYKDAKDFLKELSDRKGKKGYIEYPDGICFKHFGIKLNAQKAENGDVLVDSKVASINVYNQEEFDKATYSRFRNLSVQRIIVSLYMLLKKQCKLDEIKPNMYWIHMNSLSINLDKIDLLRHIIRKHTPQLLCLNDESWVQPMIRNSFKSFLTELYPNSCSFEIKKEFLIKPISSKNVVVYSVSNEYADIFSVSLQSLLENSATDNSFDIVILNHGIITSKKMLLEKMAKNYPNINIRFINVSDFITEFFKNIKIKSKSLYQEDCLDKLIIPIILSKYERVLYLDSDTCINTNISKIFEFVGRYKLNNLIFKTNL